MPVDYASAAAFEVRQPSAGGEPVIRLNFKNGTGDFATYNFLSQTGDVPLSVFIDTVAVSNLLIVLIVVCGVSHMSRLTRDHSPLL